MRADALRFSRHRGAWAWGIILAAVAILMIVAAALHKGYNGPAFPNRAAPESNSASSGAQNTGIGDVGRTAEHPESQPPSPTQ